MQAVTTVPAPTVYTGAPQTIIAGGYAPQVITTGAPSVYTQGYNNQFQFSESRSTKSAGSENKVYNHHGQVATLKTVGPGLDDKLTVTDYRTGETMAGVGIFFQQESDSWVYVASIVPNSSADRCGLIQPDDELVRVDNVEIGPQESLEDVRTLILGPPGSYVSLFFRRATRGGVNGDFYFFDVDLMRGSADFLNNHAASRGIEVPQQNDYSQYELEIARLRDEIEALRQQNAEQPQEDPRVAPLQDELKERMEDLRRFEQMLQRVQERTKEAEMGRNDAMQELDQLQIDNAKLVSQEREHMLAMDDLTDRSQASISQLERDKSHVENELGSERRKRAELEESLRVSLEELNRLKAADSERRNLEASVAGRLRQGHSAIAEAIQQQEDQLSGLAEVVPQLDYVHASLITALSAEPTPMAPSGTNLASLASARDMAAPVDLRESINTRGSFHAQEEYA